MFHYILVKKNKQQRNQTIANKNQLDASSKFYYIPNDSPLKVEAEMRNSIGNMRRKFKQNTKRIRQLYSGGI